MTQSPPLMTGPIPAYNNPPIQPQFFEPSQFYISNIVLGQTTMVTTSDNCNYVIGQLVRLLIPKTSGCRQLNGQQGYVIDIISATEVEVTIDSSQNVDAFISTSPPIPQPQIIAVGDVNNGIISTTGRSQTSTNVPGAFINIS